MDTPSILTIEEEEGILLKKDGEPFVNSAAILLKHFQFHLLKSETENTDRRISNNLSKWITYAGQKYPCLEALLIGHMMI